MHIPVDGSSLEAFENSLEQIKEQVTAAEYTTLNNAIDYLLVYDLAAKRDRTKLAANLDGLTAEQIIEKVQWRKGKQ
jgi:malonyl CoA-acyl carrier protein transacylase